MAKRNIGKEIIDGLEEIKAWKQGKVKLKTFAVELPRAADVQAIRKDLGFSQEEFALFMGVSVGTLRNWEQERREPHGPARSLLLVAAKQPQAVRKAFEAAVPSPKMKRYSKSASTAATLHKLPKAA
jgi:putative transcriptional regulator